MCEPLSAVPVGSRWNARSPALSYSSREPPGQAAWELNSATLEEQDRFLGPGHLSSSKNDFFR